MDVPGRMRHFVKTRLSAANLRVDHLYAIGVYCHGWVQVLLDPESYRLLQLELADRPDRGRVIVGSGSQEDPMAGGRAWKARRNPEEEFG